VRYKSQLAEKLEPHVVLCIQQKDELEPLLATLKFRKIVIDFSSVAKQRSREKRKNLREMSYAKYLTDTKVRTLPLNQLAIEENILPRLLDRAKGADCCWECMMHRENFGELAFCVKLIP